MEQYGENITVILQLKCIFQSLKKSPFFKSLALITPIEVTLWVHTEKISPDILDHLQAERCKDTKTCVILDTIETAIEDLDSWAQQLDTGAKVLVTAPSIYLVGASFAIYQAVSAEKSKIAESPLLYPKAIKNEVQLHQV